MVSGGSKTRTANGISIQAKWTSMALSVQHESENYEKTEARLMSSGGSSRRAQPVSFTQILLKWHHIFTHQSRQICHAVTRKPCNSLYHHLVRIPNVNKHFDRRLNVMALSSVAFRFKGRKGPCPLLIWWVNGSICVTVRIIVCFNVDRGNTAHDGDITRVHHPVVKK